MIDTPQVVQSEAQEAAVIHLDIPRAEMRHVMGPAIGELMAAIAAQGGAPAGPVFAHHLTTSSERFDFEVGVPVAAPIAATGRVKPGRLPATKVARTVYHGPYEGLYAAWAEFGSWLAAQGHEPASGDLWEIYAAGPESSPDPATWRTELNKPLAD
jgi:effector-binding domain-containing protein